MGRNPKEYSDWLPMTGEGFKPYLVRGINPPLEASELKLDAFVGDERKILKTPTAGDMSFVVTYQGYEGTVASCAEKQTDLEIVQLQGARSKKSYRVNKGLQVVSFFGDTINRIGTHPESPYERIVMQDPLHIEGLVTQAGDSQYRRYKRLVSYLELLRSGEENIYVRDIKKK